MQAMNEYHWAQDKIDEVVDGKKHHEEAACERRLRQMAARREKKAAKQIEKLEAEIVRRLTELEAAK